MPLDSTTTTIISAAIGGGVASVVAGGFTVWNLWLTRRSEERRQIRELAVKVAIENFRIYQEASNRLGISTQPLDVYLIHAMQLTTALDGRLKTPEQIQEHLRQSLAASNVAATEIDEYNKKLQEARSKK
jgi:hypothetical protein